MSQRTTHACCREARTWPLRSLVPLCQPQMLCSLAALGRSLPANDMPRCAYPGHVTRHMGRKGGEERGDKGERKCAHHMGQRSGWNMDKIERGQVPLFWFFPGEKRLSFSSGGMSSIFYFLRCFHIQLPTKSVYQFFRDKCSRQLPQIFLGTICLNFFEARYLSIYSRAMSLTFFQDFLTYSFLNLEIPVFKFLFLETVS